MKASERIKILRTDQRLSQTEFGARLGVSRSVIKRLEHGGHIGRNKLTLVKLMAIEFGVKEDWLLHGDTAKPEYTPSFCEKNMAELAASGASAQEAAFIAAYLSFDAPQRKAILRHMVHSIQNIDEAIRRAERNEGSK